MPENREIRLALLISGSGTTMEQILLACNMERLCGITPACVIASSDQAGGLAKARRLISYRNVLVIDPETFGSKGPERDERFGEAIITACRERGVDWIGQYGWMPQTPKNVIAAFPGRMINQHPGPVRSGLPGFGGKRMYGMRVHYTRLLFVRTVKRDLWTEATAQRVHPDLDEGEIIKIGRLDVGRHTPESLQQALLPVEYDTQIAALEDVMHGRVAPVAGLEPLVRPEEVDLLERIKQDAFRLYLP